MPERAHEESGTSSSMLQEESTGQQRVVVDRQQVCEPGKYMYVCVNM